MYKKNPKNSSFGFWALAVICSQNWTEEYKLHTEKRNICGPTDVWLTAVSLGYINFSVHAYINQNSYTAIVHPPIPIVCSLVHLQHVIFSSSVHVCQFLEAGSPLMEAVVVLVSAARRIQRGEASRVRATSFIVKHQQGVVGGCCRVIVSCLQVLQTSSEYTQVI